MDYIPAPSVSPPLFKDDGDGDTDEWHFPLSRPSQDFSLPPSGDRKFAGMMSTCQKLQRVSRIIRYRCQDKINFLAQHF